MLWERIAENRRRTFWLFVGFFLLMGLVAWAVYTLFMDLGIAIGIMLVASMIGLGAVFADSGLVLTFMGARRADPEEFQLLSNVAEEIAIAAQIPVPEVRVIDDWAPNALATGTPGRSVVAVTTGLLSRLDRDELAGVVAHEIAHIGNHDTRVMTSAFVLSALIGVLTDLTLRWVWSGSGGRRRRSKDDGGAIKLILALVVLVLAPLTAKLLSMAISRRREFLADAEAARLTRNPGALARALRRIAGDTDPVDRASLATAHLFIISPLRREHGFISHPWFSTHPPVSERIRLLEEM